MKRLKSLLITLSFLVGLNAFSQEVANPSTEIAHNGSVWFLDQAQTNVDEWLIESNMLDMMALQTVIHDEEASVLWGLQKEKVSEGDLLLGIPFLSCGIGYDYYRLIQEDDNFLLFESVDNYGVKTSKIIVLNKRR